MKCKDCNKREINLSRSGRCCDVCLDKRIRLAQKYYNNHTDFAKEISKRSARPRKEKLEKLGVCTVCGKEKIYLAKMCITCHEKSKNRAKTYRQKNKKKIQEGQKRSMAKKPELYKSLKHLTYLRHKDDWYRQRRERRARLANCEGSYTQDEWIDILDKYDNKCLQCGSSENLEADHVIPIAKGGSNSIENIQPLCRSCNRKKWTKILDFRPFGRAILDWT